MSYQPIPNPLPVSGNVASGTTDAGNPVKVGGRYNVSPLLLTDGQRADLQIGTRGALAVTLFGQNTTTAPTLAAANVDSVSAGNAGFTSISDGYVFNGVSWDRVRGNIDTAALITHASASTGVNSADQTNYNGRGVKLVIDVTAITGAAAMLNVTIQGKDIASGKYYTLLASTAISAVGTTTLDVYPGVVSAANAAAGLPLPRTWRVITVIGGTTPAVTATIGASVIM